MSPPIAPKTPMPHNVLATLSVSQVMRRAKRRRLRSEYGAVISRACLLRLYELVDNAAELLWFLKVGVVT